MKDWWNAIVVPVIAFYFIGLQYSNGPLQVASVFKVFYLLFLSMTTASFGFYLNELTDIEDDNKAGKKNFVADLSKSLRIQILLAIIFLTILSIIPFWMNKKILILFSIQISLLTIYSCKPIRLKRHPYIAIILDSLYSGTIFFFIALLYSESVLSPKIILLTLAFGIFRGLRNIIFHIDKDIEIDQKAGQKTLAHTTSSEKLYLFQSLLFIPEIISLVILLLPTSDYTFYIFILGVIILLVKRNFYYFYAKNNFDTRKKWLSEINTIYEVWLPIAVLFGTVYIWGIKAIILSCLGLAIFFPSTYRVFHEIYLLGLNFYFVGYKIYYFISDLYFVHTKPHFDIGKWWRKLRGKNEYI